MNYFHHQPTIGTKLQGKITIEEFKDIKEIYLKLTGDLHLRTSEFSRSLKLLDDTISLYNVETHNIQHSLDERVNSFDYSFSMSDNLVPTFKYALDDFKIEAAYELVLCIDYRKVFKRTKKVNFKFDLVKSTMNPIDIVDFRKLLNTVTYNRSLISAAMQVPNVACFPTKVLLPFKLALTLRKDQLLEDFDLIIHFNRVIKLRTRDWHDFRVIDHPLYTFSKSNLEHQHSDFKSDEITHHFTKGIILEDVPDFEYKNLLSLSHYISVYYNKVQLLTLETPLMQLSSHFDAPPSYSDHLHSQS